MLQSNKRDLQSKNKVRSFCFRRIIVQLFKAAAKIVGGGGGEGHEVPTSLEGFWQFSK